MNCVNELELATTHRSDFDQLETSIWCVWLTVSTTRKLGKWDKTQLYVLELCGKPPSVNSYSWVYCCTCELRPVSSVLLCWDIEFCYLQLWYHLYCNELDHFWELSPHLIGTLGPHCSELLLSVSFGALLLKKWACELITVDESLWLHVKSRVNWYTVIRKTWSAFATHPIVWDPIGAYCSAPGFTWDRVANCDLDLTSPVLVRATWVIFEKNWKFKNLVKNILACDWR